MERNTRPGNSLHEGHVSVLVEVGIVLGLLLKNGVNAGRRLVALAAAGDPGPHDPSVGIVDGNALVPERDNRHDGRAYRAGLDDLDALRLRVLPGSCGCDDVTKRQGHETGNDNAGAPPQ